MTRKAKVWAGALAVVIVVGVIAVELAGQKIVKHFEPLIRAQAIQYLREVRWRCSSFRSTRGYPGAFSFRSSLDGGTRNADDGSFEFKGPTRAYGYEAKAAVELTRHLSLNGGLTKVANAFYKGGDHRVYVDSAPHLVANAALTVSAWHGWSDSLRMRAINHYRLDGEDPSIIATGHTVIDLGVAKQLIHTVELNFSVDNLTNRDYWETQNYFESRITPDAPVVARVHATPAYPLTAVAGVTLRFGGK